MTATVERHSPVGSWQARVSRPRETSTATVHFTPDGRAFLSAGGAGTWTATASDTFSFRIAEPVYDRRGTCVGWVDVDQRAVLHGGTFTGAGVSHVHGPDGATLHSAAVRMVATRDVP
ncbi:hypothetical protein [Streptomyces sparsus]